VTTAPRVDPEAVLAMLADGLSQAAVAAAFGRSRQWVSQIAAAAREIAAAEVADEARQDLELAAMRVRYQAALDAVPYLDEQAERQQLLALVVFPTSALAEASRARAVATAGGERPPAVYGNCAGCGIPFAEQWYTTGCRPCNERRRGRARREREAGA
jgi:hypothetical protein